MCLATPSLLCQWNSKCVLSPNILYTPQGKAESPSCFNGKVRGMECDIQH